MQRRYFGTDGIRGPVGGPLLNAAFAARLGRAAARWLRDTQPARSGWPVLIGMDTRASGPELALALAAGLSCEGCLPRSLGVVPTPAVALAVRNSGAALGIVITASHNPASDNGIKFFSASGMKLDDAQELAIEACLPDSAPAPLVRPLPEVDAFKDYCEATAAMLPKDALRGWTIVLDTAHGATFRTSAEVLVSLGAELRQIGAQPDGSNINAGFGSEHPEALAKLVLQTGARLGIAHDGDGDRCILCDETGVLLDGDEILTLLALHALQADRLPGRRLVVTVQSNLGVEKALQACGGVVERTAVGDRYVIERMLATGAVLGGESSGHIIRRDVSPTGDGLVAALGVLQVMRETGKPLSELRRCLSKFPQASKAIKVPQKLPLETLPTLPKVMAALETELGSSGRLLVRYSGTEAKLRLLVEAETEAVVAAAMARLEAAVSADLLR